MKTTVLRVSLIFLFIGISNVSGTVGQNIDWRVNHSGAMSEMFQTGNIEGKTEISKLTPQKGLYGVGPLENLSGEIMIWNGRALVSFVERGSVLVKEDPAAKAVFFVWANVAKWREIQIPKTVKSYDDIEKFIGDSATVVNLNSAEAFPFLLEGTFQALEFHINNYRSEGTKLTREKHDAMKYRSKLKNTKLEMLGFYSPKHQGVFTHHTRRSHIHATDNKRSFVGHVDDLALDGAVKLFLPVQ